MDTVEIDKIKRFVNMRVWDYHDRDDIFQIACMYSIATKRQAWWVVSDAIRTFLSSKERPDRPCNHLPNIACLYSTNEQLIDRWFEEETEDQMAEWELLSAAERDRRIAISHAALGTTYLGTMNEAPNTST